jgi:hypothetical protein
MLASAVTVGAVLWAVARYVFAPPTLAISVQVNELRMPFSLYRRFDAALLRDSSRLTDSSALVMRQVQGFLRDTRNFTQITLTNSSASSLANLDLRVKYVHDLAGWAIDSDALDDEEQRQLLNAVHYDASESLLTLRTVPRLPPKATLNLFIWGDVSYAALLGDEQVTAAYDGGAGKVITERTVRGVDAFIYENAGLLVLVVLVSNVGVWNLLLQHRAGKGVTQESATTSPTASES